MADAAGSKRPADAEVSAGSTLEKVDVGGNGGGASSSGGGGGGSSSPKKRARTAEEEQYGSAGDDRLKISPSAGGPLTIVTFNVNGGVPRMTKDWREINEFITNEKPDAVFFQEWRMPAKGPPKCTTTDNVGRKRGQLKDNTKRDREDVALVNRTLLALARRLGYRVVMSLANSKKAGSAALISNTCPAKDIYYSFDSEGKPSKSHDDEGRVIVVEYPSMTVAALYVPNNGVKEESFRRRERWDASVRRFVNGFAADGQPLVLCGDLNVAHKDEDLTHPEFFKSRMFPAANPDNSGQPGCTPAEKRRHSLLLECGGGLVDAYRHLHPAAAAGTGTDAEGMTWRGTAGNQFAEAGRYYGKGMRIDYFLTSKALTRRIKEVKVFGSGADRKGFLGSDHCPLKLTLLPPE